MSLEEVQGFHVKSSKKRCSEVLGGARILAEAEQNPSTSLGSSRAPLFSDLNLAEQSRAPLYLGSNEPVKIPLPSREKKNSIYFDDINEVLGSKHRGLHDIVISKQEVKGSARQALFQATPPTGYRKSLADKRVYCYVHSVGLRNVMIIDAINRQRLEIPAVVWDDCFIK